MEIESEIKKHSDDESSSEENEIGKISQKIDLKLDLIPLIDETLKKKDNLIVANKIFLGLWGTSSIFLQAVINEFLLQKKAILVGYINFNKSKQKALAHLYSISDLSYVIIFNEAVKDYSECDFSSFFSKNFLVDSKYFEFVIFDNISNKLLKNIENCQQIRFISTNQHSKESYEALKHLGTPLEEGNGLEGIGAEIIIFCEMNGLNSNLFLGVNEEYEFNINDVKKFAKISQNYDCLKTELDDKRVSEIIKKTNKSNYSSIYL